MKAKDGTTNALNNGTSNIISISDPLEAEQKGVNTWTVSTWGYKPNKFNSAANTNYLPGPTNGDVIDNTTNSPANTKTTYNFQIAAKVDNTLPTGSYANTFVFEATVNKVGYKITYDANGGTSAPDAQSGNSGDKNIQLSYVETGSQTKAFEGWCTEKPTGKTCSGDTYKLKSSGNTVTLYAIWDEPEVMQNWKGCTEALIGRQITLKDSRDNKLYYVAKLADGNCWMTENLDFDIDSTKTYTRTDMDLGYAKKDGTDALNGDGDYEWKPDYSTYTDNTWIVTSENPQSYDPGDLCWIGTRSWHLDEINYTYSDHSDTDLVDCEKSANPEHYRIGNYYNYTAAVAQNDTSTTTGDGDHYNTSICPAGWQLPSNKGKRSFVELGEKAQAAGMPLVAGYIGTKTDNQTTKSKSTVHEAPYYFVYGGFWQGSSRRFGYTAVYTLNAISSKSGVYYMYFTGDGTFGFQSSNGGRHVGEIVRCVARQ